MKGYAQQFGRMFSPKMMRTHYAVYPLVAIMAFGLSWCTAFGIYSLLTKTDVNLSYKRERFIDLIDLNKPQKLLDARNFTKKPYFYGPEARDFVELKREIYNHYYPK